MGKFVYDVGKSFLFDFVYEFNVYTWVSCSEFIDQWIHQWGIHMFAKFKGNIYSHHIIHCIITYMFMQNSSCLVCVERK